MAYVQMTPQERMARARQLRAQREARLGYQPSSESLLANYLLPTERSVGVERVQDAVKPTAQRKDSNVFDDVLDFFGDAGATVFDVGANLATGAVDVLEGIVDLGAGFVGKIGGYFSDEFESAMEDVIAYDASRNWIEKPLDDMGLSRSWLNQGEVGDLASNVLQGVGGLLPAVVLTAATGGIAGVGLGVTMAGAAGGATEEALNDGANLGQALNYGVVTGAIEGGTEAALGGVPVFGKGFLKSAKEVAETGGKRILKGMLEEGAEEAGATFLSPLAKTTYKGAEALREYVDPEFYGDILKDAAAGALVSGAYGGTVGHIMHQSGKDADIRDSMEAIKEVKKKRRTLHSDSKLTPEEDTRLRGSYEANMQNIQTALQKASPKERAALIKRHRLGNAFTEDGQIRPDFAANDYTLSTTPPTDTNGVVEDRQGSPSVSEASTDNRYRSADLIGHDAEIKSDLGRITEALRSKGKKNANAKVDLFRGELSENARSNFTEMMKATDVLSDHTQTGINLAIVDSGGKMNGVILGDGNTVYMDYRVLESGIAPKVLVEEVAHFSEETQSYGDVVRFIAEDKGLKQRVFEELTDENSGYGFSAAAIESLLAKMGNQKTVDNAARTEYNEVARFNLNAKKKSKGFAHTQAYKKITNAEREYLYHELIDMYRGVNNGIADGIALVKGNTIYIVDSGRDNGKLDFQVRKRITISNDDTRVRRIERINNDAISKGFISGQLSDRIGTGRDHDYDSNLRRESGAELSADQEQSGDNKAGVSGEVRGSERGGGGVSFSLPSQAQSNETLTAEESELFSELNAHMVAETLGNSDFMQKLIKGKPNLAEKLINRVKALSAALSGSESKEARTQRKRLAKAEKLWMQAVEDAGYKYVNNKLHAAIDEAEEEEAATRMNAEKVQDAEALDNATDAEYNRGAQFSIDSTNDIALKELDSDGNPIYETDRQVSEPTDFKLLQQRRKESATKYGLTERQCSSLEAYVKGIAYLINRKSRDGNIGDSDKTYILTIIEAVKKFPEYEGRTYRNLIFANKASYEAFLDENAKGEVVKLMELTSTSKRPNGYPLFGKYVVHMVLDGVSGKDIADTFGVPKQQEVLFLPGVSYKVNSVSVANDGHPVIFVKEIVNSEVQISDGNTGGHNLGVAASRGNDRGVSRRAGNDTGPVLLRDRRGKENSRGSGGSEIFESDSIKSTEDSSASFSLPKRKSDGARAKQNANREGSKTYTRSDSNAIVDVMIEDSVFGYGEYVGTLKGKGNIVDALWVTLNSSDKKGRKAHAFKLADAVIDSLVLNLSVDDPVMETYTDRVEKLHAYVRKLDLDSIKDELKNTGKAQSYRSRWQKQNGKGMTPDQIVEELRDRGVVIDADNPADILFEMDRLYTEALQGIKDNSNLILAQVLDKSELDAYRNDLARKFLEESEARGSMSQLSREYYEQYLQLLDATQKEIAKNKDQMEHAKERYDEWRATLREKTDAFTKEMREKFSNEREEHRLSRQIAFRAEQFKKLKLGKMHEAAEFNAPLFRKSIGALGSVVRGGQVSEKSARKISADLAQWLKWMEEQNAAAAKENEGRSFDLKRLREMLEEIADPSRSGEKLSVNELKNLSYVMARLTTYVNDYGKIRRNGKMIDALPVAEGYVDNSKKSSRISSGPLRAFREWYLGKFADPATVMRYADGYDEHGFFTETFEEFREGAIKVEVTRMELMESYAEFLETHKKYGDRLAETVEFRGQRIPRNVLISLWMTTKRKQAQLGLAMEGAQYRTEPTTKAEKKTDDGTRVFDIAPFGDPTRDIKQYPYTEAELDNMMQKIRAEIGKSLDDTDRAYIRMVEGIFKECGEIKYDVDMQRYGDSNVDKSQYYFPIARADVAQTIEQESWQQGLDRVSHLSMNKDTVKGAHNRLYLSGVDAILARHVNQVSLYNGIATAVDNFNLIVNLNTVDTGAAVTVNNTVTRTDSGKATLDYLKKLKSDIERVSHMDLDDAGVTKFLSYLRSAYATSTLGANPKVWVTQLSSFIAANNVLDFDSIVKGFALADDGKPNKFAEVQHKEIVPEKENSENKLYKNAQAVLKMNTVSNLSGNEFAYDGDTSLKDRVIEFFDSLGNSVVHPELGTVSLTKSSFRDDKAHGLTRQKVISFAAIPDVIANGQIIDVWKPTDKPYQRITVAAPIVIAGDKYYMGVMIQRDNQSQRMYLHDVITEKATSSFNTEPTTQKSEGIRDEGHLFITSILRKALNVNNESQKKMQPPQKKSKEAEVDKYCPLAKHRNATNTAYEAQSVSVRSISKVNDLLMKPIGAVDRFVVEHLWGACQVQVEKNGGAKVGTVENKVAAGKLLERVILETQQNALATERSSAMRSSNEVLKSLTMFSADAMKMIGRFFDAFGEAAVIRQKLKDSTLTDTERKSLEARQKNVHKNLARSIAVLLSSAAFMAAIAAAFNALLREYDDKEPEEIAVDITADSIGNLLGGLPFVRDTYSFFANGYEINMNLLTPVNGLLDATNALMTLASDGASGKNVSSRDVASAIRKGFYAGGQILGLPAKNVYKYAAGLISLVSPETGYTIDAAFVKPSYKKDLKKAIEAGDTKMIARIAELMTDENYGTYSDGTRKALRALVEEGYTVFPRSVGETLTVDGETYELTDKQRKRFEKVYAVSDRAVEDLVDLEQFKDADSEEQARALKYVYDTYYAIAVDDLLGTDTETKSVLFAELIDIEKLAMITAHVSTLTADKDKQGKTVSGSRKNKVVAYVNSLRLTAAEKYVVMGYLGYRNEHGAAQVKALINRADLSKKEKEKVLAYCGYAA